MPPHITHDGSQSIQTLLDHILEIPGHKIITLTNGDKPFIIDIQPDGQIGYHTSHKQLFMEKLHHALVEGGGMIIRQFLSIRVSRQLKSGGKGWIPEKNLYGVALQNGEWTGLEAELTQQACEMDSSAEEGVHYQTFPIR